jgi:SAM-dependent methyltransferase
MDTAATLAPRVQLPPDPYGAATRILPAEQARMDLQFQQHSAGLVQRAATALGGMQGLRLLDVGSGYGALISLFEQSDDAMPTSLQLLDLNASLLALATARARRAGLSVHPEQCAIDDAVAPVTTGSADLVVCSFAATHLHDLPRGLAAMADALRPQGLLVLVDVDYQASLSAGCPALAQTLALVQAKLHVRDLSSALPRLALGCGLVPAEGLPCGDWFHTCAGADAVRQRGLPFVSHFHADDPALQAWRHIGPDALLMLRRLAHVYRRI